MRGRWWPWLLLLLALVPALLVNQRRAPLTNATPTENVSEAILSNPNTLDPALATTASDWAVDSNVFQPLFQVGSLGGLSKNLVDKVTFFGHTVTLTIAPTPITGGGHLTATMVAASLARPLWSEVKSPLAQALLSSVVGSKRVMAGKARYLSGVGVVNASTLTIRLKHSARKNFLKTLANPALSIVPVQDMQRGGANWQWMNLYGTGGYRLTNWVPNGSLTLKRVHGRGPTVIDLPVFSSLKAATLAFRNGSVDFVPINATKVTMLRGALSRAVRSLTMPGNLYLVYRSHAPAVSTYPHLSIRQWVEKSFRGHIAPSSGHWPSALPSGRPMTIYVNQNLPEAVQLADTLAHREAGRVTVRRVSLSTLKRLARHNQIPAYIGQANLFRSGTLVPLAPMRALWLINPLYRHAEVYANGSLNWHSLTRRASK